MTRRPDRAGFTLLEAVVAVAIMGLAVGGTIMAFVTADQVTRNQNPTDYAEAAGYAQQTAEQFRNHIYAGASLLPTTWTDQPLPSPPLPPSPSILRQGATRLYRVTSEDCDGVGGVGDCYAIEVKVSWTKPSG